MIRLSEIRLPFTVAEAPEAPLRAAVSQLLGLPASDIAHIHVFKRSFDARKADLLGRKVLMENGRGMQLLSARMQATMAQAVAVPELAAYAAQLGDALQQVGAATQAAWATGNPAEALANAVPYMQAFGHTVLAWVWLDVALATLRADATLSIAASAGRMGAARYFYHYELPKIGAWLNVVNSRDTTCAALSEAAF